MACAAFASNRAVWRPHETGAIRKRAEPAAEWGGCPTARPCRTCFRRFGRDVPPGPVVGPGGGVRPGARRLERSDACRPRTPPCSRERRPTHRIDLGREATLERPPPQRHRLCRHHPRTRRRRGAVHGTQGHRLRRRPARPAGRTGGPGRTPHRGMRPGGKEEIATDVATADLRTAYVAQVLGETGAPVIGWYFHTTAWSGDPVNAEPDQCARLAWLDPADLPTDVEPTDAARSPLGTAGPPGPDGPEPPRNRRMSAVSHTPRAAYPASRSGHRTHPSRKTSGGSRCPR